MNRRELRQVLRESKAINKDVLNEGVLKNVGLGALALVAGAGLLFAKGVINFAKTGDVFKGDDRGFGSSDKGIFSIISSLFANKMKNSKSKDVRAISEKMRQMRLALSKNPEKDLAGVVDTIIEFADGDETHEEVTNKVNEDTLNQLRVYNIWNSRADEMLKAKEELDKNTIGGEKKLKEAVIKPDTEEKKPTIELDTESQDLVNVLSKVTSKEDITPKTILDYDEFGGFKRKLSDEEKKLLEGYGDNKISLSFEDIKEVWNICKKIIEKQYEEFRKDYVSLIDKVGDMDAEKAKSLLDDLRNVDRDLYDEMSKSVDVMAKDKKNKEDKEKQESWSEEDKKKACVLAAILIFGSIAIGDRKNKSEWMKRAKEILTKAGVENIDNNLLESVFECGGIQGNQGTTKALTWVMDVLQNPEKINTKTFMQSLYDYKTNSDDANYILNNIKGHLKNQSLDETMFRKFLEKLEKYTPEQEVKKENYTVDSLKRMFYNIKTLNESVTRMKSAD